jgi:hypothetical protein
MSPADKHYRGRIYESFVNGYFFNIQDFGKQTEMHSSFAYETTIFPRLLLGILNQESDT